MSTLAEQKHTSLHRFYHTTDDRNVLDCKPYVDAIVFGIMIGNGIMYRMIDICIQMDLECMLSVLRSCVQIYLEKQFL